MNCVIICQFILQFTANESIKFLFAIWLKISNAVNQFAILNLNRFASEAFPLLMCLPNSYYDLQFSSNCIDFLQKFWHLLSISDFPVFQCSFGSQSMIFFLYSTWIISLLQKLTKQILQYCFDWAWEYPKETRVKIIAHRCFNEGNIRNVFCLFSELVAQTLLLLSWVFFGTCKSRLRIIYL